MELGVRAFPSGFWQGTGFFDVLLVVLPLRYVGLFFSHIKITDVFNQQISMVLIEDGLCHTCISKHLMVRYSEVKICET